MNLKSPLLAMLLTLSLTACSATSNDTSNSGSSSSDEGDTEDPGIDALEIFDPAQFHAFEVEVAPSDWDWLRQHATLEQFVPATFIYNGTRYEKAAIRFKGSFGTLDSCFDATGAQICPKLSIKISFNEYEKKRFFGLRKLVFNSSVRDPSLMHEVLAYGLYRAMGIDAPRAVHAKLTVNGEDLGVFVMVEEVDKEFIQDHWEANDEGNLYKYVWPQFSDQAPYIAALKTNESHPDVSRMLDLYQAVRNAGQDTFASDLGATLDFDALARYLAVDRAVSNGNGISGFYCYAADAKPEDCQNSNYYWYEQPGGFATLIPWDLDYTFNDINTDLGRRYNEASDCKPVPFCEYLHSDVCDPGSDGIFFLPPQCDPLYGGIHRATWTSYLTDVLELARGPMSHDVLTPQLDAIRAKIRDAVSADTLGPGIAAFDDANTHLDNVLAGQLTEIENLAAENGL